MFFLFWYAFRADSMCTWNIMSSNGEWLSSAARPRQAKMLWPLVLFSFPWLVRPQSTQPALALDTPLSLSANNFSTSTSTPLLFALPPSSQLTISVALCASPSSNAPRVFVSNSTDSQLVPGPNGGSDVFEVTLGGLGLGNVTLDVVGDSTGLLAVYGGTTSDNLEIGVSEGGMYNPIYHSPPKNSRHSRQQRRSTSRSEDYPTLATRRRTKHSSFPHLSSRLLPRPNQRTRTIHFRRQTRPRHHSHHHPNPPQRQTSRSSSPRSTWDSPRSRRLHAQSAHASRAIRAPHRARRSSRSRCGFAMSRDGGGSGLLAVWPPSRIIACMRYRTARDSAGLYTLLPSLVCAFFLFIWLVC